MAIRSIRFGVSGPVRRIFEEPAPLPLYIPAPAKTPAKPIGEPPQPAVPQPAIPEREKVPA
jgi:hypothetical protein